MKIGLIADVHEHDVPLAEGLERLVAAGAERIIFLGDVCQIGENLEPTCRLMCDYQVEGVWGNHDFGLCEDARHGKLRGYGAATTKFAASLVPEMRIDELYFSHVEPWLQPDRIEDLWYADGLPDSRQKRERVFAAGDWRIAFAGHYHLWYHLSDKGSTSWRGESALDLSRGRHYVIVAACFQGYFAMYDTGLGQLVPMECARSDSVSTRA